MELVEASGYERQKLAESLWHLYHDFEEWYANQFKYQKVDGTPPGEELKKTTYSMEELGQRLGLKEATAYEDVYKRQVRCCCKHHCTN